MYGSLDWVPVGPCGWLLLWSSSCEGLELGFSCGFQWVVWFAGVGGLGHGLGLGLRFGSGMGWDLRVQGVGGCGLVAEGFMGFWWCGFLGGSLGWVAVGLCGWLWLWSGHCEGLVLGLSCGFQWEV